MTDGPKKIIKDITKGFAKHSINIFMRDRKSVV